MFFVVTTVIPLECMIVMLVDGIMEGCRGCWDCWMVSKEGSTKFG